MQKWAAAAFVAVALVNLPPIDLLDKIRSVYTAYFDRGLASADGSRAYAEAYGHEAALNLWKLVVCGPDGRRTFQELNAVAAHLQPKATGAMAVDGRRVLQAGAQASPHSRRDDPRAGTLCLEPSGAPARLDIDLGIDGREMCLAGSPQKERGLFFESPYTEAKLKYARLLRPCASPRSSQRGGTRRPSPPSPRFLKRQASRTS